MLTLKPIKCVYRPFSRATFPFLECMLVYKILARHWREGERRGEEEGGKMEDRREKGGE